MGSSTLCQIVEKISMAERKSILRKLKEMVPGTDAYNESQAEERAIRDRSLAAQADYEERTGETVPQEEGLEPDQVVNTLMELPLSGPMSIVNVGKSLARNVVGSGVRDAAKKAETDATTREMKQKGWVRLSGEERAKYGNNQENFIKEQIDLDKRLMQEAAAKLKEAKNFRQDPSKMKSTDVSDSYSKTKEVARPMVDDRRIDTPKRVADMAAQKPPSPASKSTDPVVRDVVFPKTEKLSVQQQKVIDDRLRRLERK